MFSNSSQDRRITQARPYRDYNFHMWRPGRQREVHSHEFLQMIHVLEGALDVDWGKGWYTLRPGDVHVLPPRTGHALRTSDGLRQFGLNFGAHEDERGLVEALVKLFASPVVLSAPSTLEIIRELESLGQTYTEHDRLAAIQLIDRYCIELLRCSIRPQQPAGQNDRLMATLRESCDRPLRVGQIAARLGMSRATLQRTCKRIFGCGAAHLHQQVRLARAAELLTDSDDQISKIADACGYPDVYQFSRAFKRHHGVPPSQYRCESRERLG